MKAKVFLGMCACLGLSALSGCMDDAYDPGKNPNILKPESEY